MIRPTADGRVGDDASDRVVMVSWWLLPRKVSVVDPSNFVGPTTRSPARLASPVPVPFSLSFSYGKDFSVFRVQVKVLIAVSRSPSRVRRDLIIILRTSTRESL